MQVSIYNALFGALTQEYRLDMVANNLANVNTTGFKQEKLAFRDVFRREAYDLVNPNMNIKGGIRWPEPNIISEPRIAKSGTDFRQGEMKSTGNPLDLALHGEGFFQVRTPEGDFFTRNGAFQLNAQGSIVNAKGHELLAGGQGIQVPLNATIEIDEAGRVRANGQQIAELDVISFQDLNVLKKRGENLFELDDEAQFQQIVPQDTSVHQGVLEDSNVQLVRDMVNMIETMRATESYQKVITATNKEDEKAINEVGRVI